jgi:TRAP-type uncharacterized transport system substrate-binding protein
VNTETKEQSRQWMHKHSPKKANKFKQTLSARKLLAAVFWDRKRVLMVEFMQQGTSKTSKVYYKTLKKLCRAIQNRIKYLQMSYHQNAGQNHNIQAANI